MKKLVLTLLSSLFLVAAYAQHVSPLVAPDSTIPPYYRYSFHSRHYVSLLTAFNFSSNDFAELGLSLSTRKRVRKDTRGNALSLSSEISLRNKVILAPKLGIWTGNGIGVGANMLYYTDMGSNTSLRFRPEIGIGEYNWKLTYGYNIALSGDGMSGVATHIVSLAVLWNLAKTGDHIRIKDWDPAGRRKYMAESHKDSLPSRNYTIILAGVHGSSYAYADVGIGFYSVEGNSRKRGNASVLGFLGAEVLPASQTIVAPKLGMVVWGMHKFGICGGVNALLYTGAGASSFVGRPELGFHYGTFRLTWGYNHTFTNYEYTQVPHNSISAVMGFKVRRGKETWRVSTAERDF